MEKFVFDIDVNNKEKELYKTAVNKNLFLSKQNKKLKFYRENRDITLEEFRKKQIEKRSASGALKDAREKSLEKIKTMPSLLKSTTSGFFNLTTKSSLKKNSGLYSPDRTSGSGFGQSLGSLTSLGSLSPQFNSDKIELIESIDYKNLLSYYERGHSLSKNKSLSEFSNKLEKQVTFKKFNIYNSINSSEKEEIQKNFNSFATNKSSHIRMGSMDNTINVQITNQLYKNPLNSYKKLKVNRQLYGSMMELRNTEQLKKYEELFTKAEDQVIKLHLMPEIRTKYLDPNRKKKDELIVPSNLKEDLDADIKNNHLRSVTRRMLFENYNEITISYINKFNNNPSSRNQSAIVKYNDFERKTTKLFLFGGINCKKLNDLWMCETKNNIFVWKLLKPKGDPPLPRNGHTAVLFKHEIFIYGGFIDAEKYSRYKDGVVIYEIRGNSYVFEECQSKEEMKWRRNHIAESIGMHMFVSGGIDDQSNFLNDTWLLEFNNLRWIKIDVKGTKIPPLAYHSSCVVIAQDLLEDPCFSLFKNPDSISNKKFNVKSRIKHEGIYIFGGINEEHKYQNEVYVIKTGKKPLERILLKINGTPPPPRSHANMNFYENLNFVLIHGGRNDRLKNGEVFNDFWIIDLENLQWYKLITNDGLNKCVTENRAEHVSIIIDNNLVILGGSNERQFISSELCLANLDLYYCRLKKKE